LASASTKLKLQQDLNGQRVLIYSYRVRYNGLLASLFLSSREIFVNELTLLNSKFACNFLALIEADLDGVSLGAFSS